MNFLVNDCWYSKDHSILSVTKICIADMSPTQKRQLTDKNFCQMKSSWFANQICRW